MGIGEHNIYVYANDNRAYVRFKVIYANSLPTIFFKQANTIPITARGQSVIGNTPAWTFSGTANDDQAVVHVDYVAWGNNGGGPTRANGTTNWSYAQNGLLGHNRIHFLAYDTAGQRNSDSDKYFIDLYVDTAAPTTQYELSGSAGDNAWYRSAVQVTLNAQDNGSGDSASTQGIPNHYAAGVERIRYRLDGGAWQEDAGGHTALSVTGDGVHTVAYYAIDKVGNTEASDANPKSLTFNIDTTPPGPPGAIVESHGVASGQWQGQVSDPAFTWPGANDTGSGVWYYRVEWASTMQPPAALAAFDPPAVRTGSYSLRVRAVDRAGNLGPEGAPFVFNYDGTPPHTPAIQNLDGVASGVWQKQVRTPNFAWPTPHDEGSGVQGYYRYWGPDENGTSDTLVGGNAFSSTTPMCAANDAATYYLRLRSQDGVGLQSDWVGYALRYDGAPPTGTLTANYGQPVAHQTTIHLAIAAFDLGGGVSQMRLSNNGYTWGDWRAYTDELYWELPAVGRRAHTVYLQLQDNATNVSGIISDTVIFDVNTPLPHSENFHLWDQIVPAGANIVTSTQHSLRCTVGQAWNAPSLSSPQYLLRSGFQAGALAAPEAAPTYTSYSQIGALSAAGGTGAAALASLSFRMYGSLGQPSHMQTVTSPNYSAELGFWGGAARDVNPPTPPPPPPPPPPECEFYSLSINDGTLFTSRPQVSVGMCGPDPVYMMLSNDGGFGGAIWQPYTRTISWTLTTYGDYVLPRFVYARYRDSGDHIHGTFFDDIIYDPNAPSGQAAFRPTTLLPGFKLQSAGAQSLRIVNQRTAELFVSAADDSSGVAEMQISLDPDFAGATWRPYSAIVPMTFTNEGPQSVYVRFRDNARNVSQATLSADSIMVDTIPPVGQASVQPGVVGPGAVSVTLALSATDAASGLSAVRVSRFAAFTDTIWTAYAPRLAAPVGYLDTLTPTLYVQFRDAAGNESQVYTTTYRVDTVPPLGAVEAVAWNGATATLHLTATDDLSAVSYVWLSPDLWFLQDVSKVAYQETLEWNFGDKAEVYVMFEDAAGNVSWPYWVAAQNQPQSPAEISKSVYPTGSVNYGDWLTYTLLISSTPGTPVGLHDPLAGVSFVKFIEQPQGILHINDVITGSLSVTPAHQVTTSFVVQVSIPGTLGWTISVTNRACVYARPGSTEACFWSNEVSNSAFRPYAIFLPLVLRNR